MKKIKALLILVLSLLAFSGCATKENKLQIEYKDRYIKQPVYDFKIVDINGAKIMLYSSYISSPSIRIGVNAYKEGVSNYEIRLAPRDVEQVCKPYLNKAKGFYRGVTDFYEWQITDYKQKTKE